MYFCQVEGSTRLADIPNRFGPKHYPSAGEGIRPFRKPLANGIKSSGTPNHKKLDLTPFSQYKTRFDPFIFLDLSHPSKGKLSRSGVVQLALEVDEPVWYSFYTMFEFDDAKSKSNKDKHGIDFLEAQALWNDPYMLEVPAKTVDEPRYLAVGVFDGKHWSAVITYRDDNIRIISVRRARAKEVELYES